MFERGSVRLFRVRGVPIRAHWSLLLILPYLVFVLSAQFGAVTSAADVPREALTLPAWVWGFILAIGLFASVVLHELAHVFVATRFGGRVRGITLMLLGGVSHITKMPRRPRYEALTALAGPALSIALGLLLIFLTTGAREGSADLVMAGFYLGTINIVVGIFNLLPAFPMDGGRVLRAVLAARMGPVRATRAAAVVGKVLAVGMALLGLWSGNLLLVVIGMFVYFGAGAEATGERAQAALEGLTAADLLPPVRVPDVIATPEPLSEALPRMRAVGRPALIVVDEVGAPVAVLEAADLARIPAAERPHLTVQDLVPRLRRRHVLVRADEPALEVIQRAGEHDARHVIVMDPRVPDGVLGLVSSPEIGAVLEMRLAEEGQQPLPQGA